ncbi:conserved hypothetical protein [Crocosphaera subtropica ATCC 51142]|uniref:vWA-MoxR associated protein N-terminal HTH domain-containing protein n=1 Tax=Crocosphaera subtropica (strain ATCC 51142 / BH68) TaxID=43989 RepID=B1WRK9_CROS5|nr:AAA-like domain-containing protein [Crocosphaera subtropica]ACB53450.1 conserved hypothetical protein [Crocosphaera subtropica ATCC 51142]
MNLDYILQIIDSRLTEKFNQTLNPVEILILQGIWEEKTYSKIALEKGYSPGYLTNVVAPEMYQKLAKLTGERLTKKNCKQRLESFVVDQVELKPQKQNPLTLVFHRHQARLYPSGSIPLDSPCYLKRADLEDQINQEIIKAGALVRIKGPREMGKTSLLLRNLDYARQQGYYSVNLSLEQAEAAILKDLNKLLRWLCANLARQLEIKPKLNEYWDQDLGSKISCTAYFQDYVLELLDQPLVLAIDELSCIFEYSSVAKDFLLLLRSWYEEAKTLPVWQKLRLIVIHSTEIYVPLQLNQSPFNVGLPINLIPFYQQEVEQLAQCYGLNWKPDKEVKQLMNLVGGHPALVHLAIYHLSRENITVTELLKNATQPNGIYYYHLQRHWITLQEQPDLMIAYGSLIRSEIPVKIDSILAYKLSSLGLIEYVEDKVKVSCELYRCYFENLIKEKK